MTGLSAPFHSLPAAAPSYAGPLPTDPSGGPSYRVATASGQQVLTVPQMAELYKAGTITASTYVWREGMPEWKTAPTLPELAAALAALGVVVQAPEEAPEEETRISMPYGDLARQLAEKAAPPSAAPQPDVAARNNGLPTLPEPSGSLRASSAPAALGTTGTGQRPLRKTLPPRATMQSLSEFAIPLNHFNQNNAASTPSVPPSSPPPVQIYSSAPAAANPAPGPSHSFPPTPIASVPAPARPIEFEAPPRSAAPVSLSGDYPVAKRRTGTLVLLSAAIALTLGAGSFALLRRSPPAPVVPVPAAVAPPPAPAPAPTPVAPEPTASVSASTPAPTSAESTSKARSSSRAARSTAAPSRSRKSSEDSESEATESSSTPAAPETETTEPTKPAASEPDANPDIAAPQLDPPFDRTAASLALGEAASNASSCKEPDGPTGSGQATVTFSSAGKVTSVSVSGDFAGTGAGACVVRLFKAAKVPAFAGDAMTVSKRFTIN